MGYTLIELVIVMVVLGVLAAVAGPRFFTQQTFSDRGYADELGAALRATQKAAVISGCAARLTIGASSYAAAQQAAAGNSCDQADTSWSTAIVGPDGAALQGSAPSGTTASPTGVFQFDGRGRLSVSPATTIAVGGRSITIEPGTGFIQVL
jgi:MSHA pilin protein MshC